MHYLVERQRRNGGDGDEIQRLKRLFFSGQYRTAYGCLIVVSAQMSAVSNGRTSDTDVGYRKDLIDAKYSVCTRRSVNGAPYSRAAGIRAAYRRS